MSKFSEEETEDLAEMMQGIYAEGIEVTLRKGDLRKIFTVIIVANVVTYVTLRSIKAFIKLGIEEARKAKDSDDESTT